MAIAYTSTSTCTCTDMASYIYMYMAIWNVHALVHVHIKQGAKHSIVCEKQREKVYEKVQSQEPEHMAPR